MTQFYDKDNNPILEQLSDQYLYRYYPWGRYQQLERMNRADSGASLEDAMDMIADLLVQYEECYSVAKDDNWELLFPYLLMKPSAGDKLKNMSTGEVYTIKRVFVNDANKRFEGVIKLETGTTPPSTNKRERLKFLNSDRYMVFSEEGFQQQAGTQGAGDTLLPPIPPTVTYVIVRSEPASMKGFFKDAFRETKMRIREIIPDPEHRHHSIEIRGQRIDNLVQFDCWENDPKSASILRRWFEEFMRQNVWILLKNGVGQIHWWANLLDKTVDRWRQNVYARSAQYAFRTENLEAFRIRDLTRLNVKIDTKVGQFLDDDPVRIIAGQTIIGEVTQSIRRSKFFDAAGNYRFGSISIIDDGV